MGRVVCGLCVSVCICVCGGGCGGVGGGGNAKYKEAHNNKLRYTLGRVDEDILLCLTSNMPQIGSIVYFPPEDLMYWSL